MEPATLAGVVFKSESSRYSHVSRGPWTLCLASACLRRTHVGLLVKSALLVITITKITFNKDINFLLAKLLQQ